MKIEPIISWLNGQEMQGTEFNLRIINDNLLDLAQFYYNVTTSEVSHMEERIVSPLIPAWDETLPDGTVVHHDEIPAVVIQVKIVDTYPQQLSEGNLTMNGQEYQDWDDSSDVNGEAYVWAAAKLKLVLIPNQEIPLLTK